MSRPRPTLSDAVVVAISPMLIMALVGSLVFFLAEAFYGGEHQARLNFICFMFVMASVCIGRISIEEGGGRATMFALPLAIVTVLAVWRFVPLGQFGMLSGVALVALIMWSSYKLTWDCTVVEDWQQASNEGILQSLGLDEPPSEIQQTARHGRASRESQATAVGDVERATADSSEREDRKRRTYWWDVLLGRSKKPKVPGRWVVYFSLAAIPLYGIGQMAIPASDLARRRYAFLLLCVYVASGLALLVTTSFLGVRRYLRQRRVEMPASITRTWLVTGGVLIVALMFAAWLLPRPGGSEYSVTDLAPFDKKPRQASPYAVGSDGVQGKGQNSSSQSKEADAGQSSGSGAQKGSSGDQSGSPQSKTGSPGKSGESSGQSAQGQQNSGGSGGDRSNSQSGDKQGGSGQSDKSGQSGANQSGTNDKNGGRTGGNRTPGEQGNDRRGSNQNDGENHRTNGQPTGSPPNGSQSNSGQQQSDNGQQRADGQGARTAQSQNESSPGNQRGSSTSSQSSRNSWSPSQMFSGIAPWLALAIKWVFYLSLLAIALYVAWRWRAELKRELSKLWAEFKKLLAELHGLWARLWNREKPAPTRAPEQSPEGQPPPRPFASFADPFASGAASSLSPEELVQYSFEALEAWGRENDCPRSPEQTPYEYSWQIARREQSLSGAARDLAEVYSLTAYAGASLVPASVDRLRRFWEQLTTSEMAP